jgi:pectate lyase
MLDLVLWNLHSRFTKVHIKNNYYQNSYKSAGLLADLIENTPMGVDDLKTKIV